MDAVRRANHRIRQYPAHLAKCSAPAAKYAACVTRDLNVQRGACETEFQLFRQCVQKAAAEMRVRV